MRFFLISTFLCCILFSVAQIPNYEFENWSDRELYEPVNWMLEGFATYTSDASSGGTAVLLENKNGGFGYVTNTLLTGQLLGEPYEDFPLTCRFSAKYDLADGDTGKVLAIFKSSGAPVGTIDFNLTGNSGDTFTTFKYPIQWSVNLYPDSIIFVVSSKDFTDQVIDGDGYVIIDNIVMESFGNPHQQLLNNDFETVDTTRIPYPNDWYTTNLIGIDLFGDNSNNEAVVQTDESHHGIGMLVQNVYAGNDLVPGFAVTGDTFDMTFPPTFAVSKRWSYLQGYYKYQSDNNDAGVIYAILYYQGSPIGSAQFNITEDQENLTYFSSQIVYGVPSISPDSAVIIIGCADFENPKGENTKLWVDRLSFSDGVASIPTTIVDAKFYPNPVRDRLHIITNEPMKGSIANMLGQEVLKFDTKNIDVSMLNPGTYHLRYTVNGALITTKFIKL